jgi:hypothetical protein
LGKAKWRSEPTDVEKSADEMWLGVKCQSSQELAGSPRNVLRRSGNEYSLGVKHCFGAGCLKRYQIETNSEYQMYTLPVRRWGISFIVKRETAQTTS